ncbi:RidA family protein [Saccharothrix australiensis]|uniref:RidA family protein n=1 Tax=Saccharothrix australiensis TaxID=2072 RepID=UPI001FEB5DBD|nr:Rid family hydrolase [Saccharothrix australiensis]
MPARSSGSAALSPRSRASTPTTSTRPRLPPHPVVEAGRTAYLAGQCPLDPSGALVGQGDLDARIDQVAANALAALDVVGAKPDQVVRSVIHVVTDDGPVPAAAWERLTGSVIGSAFTTASTLLGVAQLGFPGQLVEVDLTVALGRPAAPDGDPRGGAGATPERALA